jgi:hypothetical protein
LAQEPLEGAREAANPLVYAHYNGKISFSFICKYEIMARIGNMLLCLVAFVGVIASFKCMYDGSRPCSSDGCLIRLDLFLGAIIFLIAAPIFYVTLKRELARHQKNREK